MRMALLALGLVACGSATEASSSSSADLNETGALPRGFVLGSAIAGFQVDMGRGERGEELEGDVDRVLGGELADAIEHLRERLAVEALHDEVRTTVLEIARIGERADVRMVKGRAGAIFPLAIATSAFDARAASGVIAA